MNLNTIVKSYRPPNDEGVVQHDAVVAVSRLKAAAAEKPVNVSHVALACNELCSVCDAGLADRCLAAKCGAYDVLTSFLRCDNGADYIPVVLPVLLSLVDGQPDILELHGATRIVNILRDSVVPVDVIVTALNLIRRCCILHEANRQQFVALDIIPLTAGLLTTHHSHREVVRAVCAVFSALTLDDDVRVPYGKSHEHAKAIVIEGRAIDTVLQLTSGTGTYLVLLCFTFKILLLMNIKPIPHHLMQWHETLILGNSVPLLRADWSGLHLHFVSNNIVLSLY